MGSLHMGTGVEAGGAKLAPRLTESISEMRVPDSAIHNLTASSQSEASHVYLCCVSLIFDASSFSFCSLLRFLHHFCLLSYDFYYLFTEEVRMDAFTPAQTTELVSRIGAKKARMRIDKMFVNSFLGGALISFGCALALSTNSSPWFQTNAPGLIRTISAMVFPVGLISKSSKSRSFPLRCFEILFKLHTNSWPFIVVVLTGADLFTSYCMYSVVALLHRRCSVLDLLKTWVVSFFGNLAGALFFMAVLTGCKFSYMLIDGYIANRYQMAEHSRVETIKMKHWHLQRPSVLLQNGTRSSSKAFSVCTTSSPSTI